MNTGLIGITSAPLHMGGVDWLKKELLLYEKVGMLYLEESKYMLRTYSPVKARRADTYEWLQEQDVLFEPIIPDEGYTKEIQLFLNQAHLAYENFEYEHPSDIAKYRQRELEGRKAAPNSFDHQYNYQTFVTRAMCCELRTNKQISAVSMLSPKFYYQEFNGGAKKDVARVIINSLPLIGNDISFEDVLSLRSEPEMIRTRSALRSWLRKFDSTGVTELEMLDEIQHIKNEYKFYLDQHKIKYELGTIESLVKFTVGVIEDICKLKLKNLADTAFTITKENMTLSQAELSAPGKELAYLVKLDDRLT